MFELKKDNSDFDSHFKDLFDNDKKLEYNETLIEDIQNNQNRVFEDED